VGALRTIVTSLIAAAALGAPAWAAEDDWPVLKSVRLDERPPWAAFALYDAAGQTVGVTLYTQASADGPVILARRVRARAGQAAQIDWASASACPALASASAALEDLPVPRIEAPGVGRTPRSSNLILEGSSYFLWASDARFSGGERAAQIELRTVEGSPVAEWIDRTLAATAGCWSPARP
jgi:hypothetical protein